MSSAAPQRLALPDLAATHRLAQAVAAHARRGDAILLEGELGAGKSAFARAFLRAVADDETLEVPSPTFTLVQSYETRLGAIHHYDLWRLDGPAALAELDWDESRDDIVLVEWPDRLDTLRPAGALTLHLTLGEAESRTVEITGWADRALLPLRAWVTERPKPSREGGEGTSLHIAHFLADHGYAGSHAAPLAQDASFRRYLRLTGGPRPAVLMDAPPPEDVRPFLRIAAHLAAIGLSVPDIIAADPDAGLVLEEDLGDALFPTVLSPATQDELFDVAIDTLVALQRAAPPPDLLPWSPRQMRDTALGTLFDWWWPASFGSPAPQAARDDIATALTAILAPLDDGPRGFVHRDWFAGNLLWLPDRRGIRQVGVIDFQGAAIGHPAYDLVSLLQDARRDIPAALQDRTLARYLAARPELEPHAFRAAYDACAAQRHLRVACQWVRLAQRDDRPHYLTYGPRTWALLQAALTRPATTPLANALDRWIPPASRGNPPGLAA